jgi:hypothetical protein
MIARWQGDAAAASNDEEVLRPKAFDLLNRFGERAPHDDAERRCCGGHSTLWERTAVV